jgi:putative transposase
LELQYRQAPAWRIEDILQIKHYSKLELGATEMQNNSSFHYGNLPHWQPAGATFFVTMRLADSIPKHIIEQIKTQKAIDIREKQEELKEDTHKLTTEIYLIEKKYFGIFDKVLDKSNEPYWLKEKAIAEIVRKSIAFFEGKELKTHAYCIMPNHLHWVFTHHVEAQVLWRVVQRMKSFTAKEANKLLNREGQFWEAESYDHIVRDAKEFDNIVWYTLQNPVKAGFVKEWQDWQFSYANEDFWK